MRYGQLVTELVEGRLLALLTNRYGVSRSHVRQAKQYLGCDKVHLCAMTWDIPSRAVVRREENCSFVLAGHPDCRPT